MPLPSGVYNAERQGEHAPHQLDWSSAYQQDNDADGFVFCNFSFAVFSRPSGLSRTFLFVMTSVSIEQLPAIIKEDVEDFLRAHPGTPAARLRPRMAMAGDVWLVFVGPELRKGATGLGQTPRDALEDFNRHFMEPLLSRNGSDPH
jgi:hypothetical protein